MELINRELRRLRPDLVALQEVVCSAEVDQLADLLDRTDLRGTHQDRVARTAMPWTDRYGGSAIASRWPHRVVELLDLRMSGATDVPWATIAAIVELPGEGDVLFIGTTFAWRLSAE